MVINENKLNIAFYCSSVSWGGLEMNFVRHANWVSEMNYNVFAMFVEGSPLDQSEWSDKVARCHILRNKKYFDLSKARVISGYLKENKISRVWITDNRDLDLFAWIKTIWCPHLKIVYRQAMRLGVAKKDLIHTWRFNKLSSWVTTLPYMTSEVLEKTKVNKNRITEIPLARELWVFDQENSSAKSTFGIEKDQFVIGVLGRIDPLKGQLFVLENFPSILKDFPNAHLLIVGEPTKNESTGYLEKIRNFMAENQLGNRVSLHDYISNTEMFYQACDLVVVPSNAETFGMVTIEAMASGKAIIGTNTAGTPEILGSGEFGLLYTPDDSSDFIAQIKKMKDDSLRLEFGKKARQRAFKRYSKESWMKSVDDLIQSLRLW